MEAKWYKSNHVHSSIRRKNEVKNEIIPNCSLKQSFPNYPFICLKNKETKYYKQEVLRRLLSVNYELMMEEVGKTCSLACRALFSGGGLELICSPTDCRTDCFFSC